MGGFTDPSIETILSLRPDLVVGIRGPGGAAIVGTLEARGVRTYFPETESKDQIVSLLRGLGERTGRAKEAAALVSGIEAELAAVRNVVAKKPKRRALLVYGRAPLVVAGRGSFADEMLTLAGIENACASNEHYPTIDVERVLAWDPDDVLDASVGMGMDADDPSYFRTAGWRFQSCSLFSPMGQFASQAEVREVALAALAALQVESVAAAPAPSKQAFEDPKQAALERPMNKREFLGSVFRRS